MHKRARYFSGEKVQSFYQILRIIPDPQKEKRSYSKLPCDFCAMWPESPSSKSYSLEVAPVDHDHDQDHDHDHDHDHEK